MSTDAELLRRFVEERSETAFTDLVQRHLPLVRATALRRVGGDAHAADDVTQQVFVDLARKAPSLLGHATLAGWLYVGTHHATAEWVRREQRRKQREAAAHSMQLTDSPAENPGDASERLRPLLDDALVTLKPDEREAIVLRFFANHSFAEIGKMVQSSEDAARKRVERALEKLQAVLARRGFTSTVTVLGAALVATAALSPVPPGLVLQVAGTALTKGAASSAVATLGSLLWPAAATAVVVAGTLAILPAHRDNRATAKTIAALEAETQTARHDLTAGNRRLQADVTHARNAADARANSASTTAVAKASVSTPAATSGKEVTVSPRGEVSWEGKAVTLDEFMALLAEYQSSATGGDGRIVIKAPKARFRQLAWVLEQVRFAGTPSLVVESDARPEGPMFTWF